MNFVETPSASVGVAQSFSIVTPAGNCMVVASGDVVIACGFTSDMNRLLTLIHPSLRPSSVDNVVHHGIADAINSYFEGDVRAIDSVPVRQCSTPLRERGWHELRQVGPGDAIGYGELAKRMDMVRGARAAGQVCARNAASLFIPCHRIVASDSTLNHYGWGLPAKQWLLDFENLHA